MPSFKPLRVYVAGSSKQLDRARWAMTSLRALGHEVTHDWVSIIEARGEANPTDASPEQRAAWADEDRAGVRAADVLWLLMPAEGDSVGCFWEAGIADELRKPIVVSGLHQRTIFTAGQACHTFDTDALLEFCRE